MSRPHPLRVRRSSQRAPLDGAVLVARPSRWGNPFRVEAFGREEALRRYEEHLRASPELMAALPTLRGRRLACYCPLSEPCHGDLLARLANGGEEAG
jgi:hypothetical protein